MSDPASIEDAVHRSALLRAALEMAREAHAGQIRSASGGRPYIDHPLAVAGHLAEHTGDEELLAAALLHDVLEDSELRADDVRERCGERVAEIVVALTDDPSIEPYAARKREHRERVGAAGPEARAIYAADKLANVEMLRDAYELQGEGVGAELKVPLDEKVGIWEQDLGMLREHDARDPVVRELAGALESSLSRLAEDRSKRPAG